MSSTVTIFHEVKKIEFCIPLMQPWPRLLHRLSNENIFDYCRNKTFHYLFYTKSMIWKFKIIHKYKINKYLSTCAMFKRNKIQEERTEMLSIDKN